MLKCCEVTERADDYVDGQLGLRSALQVRLHLLVCRSCRTFMRQMRIVGGLIQDYGKAPRSDEPDQVLLEAFRNKTGGDP